MATVTRTGNIYTVAQEGEAVFVRLDRPIKKALLKAGTIEFPSIYGYPITLPLQFSGNTITVYEYGEVANEHYWDQQSVPQGV